MIIPLLKYIYESVVTKNVDPAILNEQLDATLLESEMELRNHNYVNNIVTETNPEIIPLESCIVCKGKITSLNSEMAMIDNKYEFRLTNSLNLQLRSNQTVSYLLHKNSDGQMKIAKIQDILNEQWDGEDNEEQLRDLQLERPEIFPTHKVIKMGVVTDKRKTYAEVEVDGDEKLDVFLDEVEVTFQPRIGDQVSVTTIVQTNPQLVTESGMSVKVDKMEPTIHKRINGHITFVDSNEYGIISQKYLFFWDALDIDYRTVNVNDKVRAECIECNVIKKCSYRCLKVYLEETAVIHTINNLDQNRQKRHTMNKHGVEVQDNISVELTDINETKEFSMIVKNTSNGPRTVLNSIFMGNKSESQLMLISPNRNSSFTLQPDEEKEYLFKATSKYFGSSTEHFKIKFERINSVAMDFSISRFFEINVEDTKKLHPSIGSGKNLHQNRTYTKNVFLQERNAVIPGVPLRKAPNFVKVKFQRYDVPRILIDNVLGNFTRISINESLNDGLPFLKQLLTMTEYTRVFHHLLFLEEIEMYHAMRKYDREKVHFAKENGYLSLVVLNMAETRPSLVIGDSAIVSCPWNPEKKNTYRGIIHKVLNNRVLLKFNENFHAAYNCEDYKIVFEFSRTSLMKQHHAVELVMKKKKFAETVLFPNRVLIKENQLDINLNENDGKLYLAEKHVPWYNESLNIVQKEAIANILKGAARPMPYVIFGPPGTGKTITLIETILQIVKRIPHSRIMVATPSNSSANLITERIMDSGILERGDFIRLVGENSIEKEQIPASILPYCGTIDIARDGTTKDNDKVTESGLKINCNSKYLMQRRLLIGTCITLGTLMQCDIPEEHFTHVIVDESGQCLETEIIIPMSFVDKDQGQIILAGDPMQLGPIVLSRYAADRGLDKSFLVRLLDQRPYLLDEKYDPRLITRLVNNYRAMPSIMSVYSGLFYNNALIPMVNDTDSVESEILAKVSSILPNYGDRDVTEGVIFIGVQGKNEQCTDSPSWFNMSESKSVFNFLIKLYRMGYGAKDIGIITPYMQQVKAIRSFINEASMDPPKVGTVEEFQGQERQIILLSTVRSTYRQMQNDRAHSLGFVKSSKRMNVAISRARALLVVFGSPTLLSRDENWNTLIRNCIEKKCSDNCDRSILNMNQNSDEDDE